MDGNIDLTYLISGCIILIAGLVTRHLIPCIKSRTDANRLDKIKIWVKTAVEAAEMIYKDQGMGMEKKAHVLKFLEGRGFTLDPEEIDNLIEAAVLELKKAT